ncbi:ATP-binding cassette domain-containing protein [Chromobacterium subtsugae]|uniref:ATP-binding cassette domain-containing protein n=1 Tax=Chromobacterium subtsugae TaxID=251747 RepID=A0ABS7FE50_9NEIS|nr:MULTISPECIES: ABC transporter transmembrane domain-containing protein [Chromobacterium]KUM03829.1 ABC transporter ATP-binding protein [Chromobacterium subtsugae]KZE87510.1 ABC transporter ATP-binding protein [Chromobacterium sp. F49]MBW7566661.1 ATP-binding cassette domain-containing protein [Chromobacterium subtsugae]MBW8288348.1 ATP-binding cassette domain-containing protein [Chromobacterium subtsugae]OBU87207.1 ABC transporter ATP-binding protein [Chromobacterium subtsugae]
MKSDATRTQSREAVALLTDAARPDLRHLWLGGGWLLIAALLEAAAPLLGKIFIDSYLLPHRLEWSPVVGLLAGSLALGVIAAVLRYRQLVRLAGVAMRAVLRLRERVYGHVIRLPMAFFDQAITGQLVSRVTNDTESVKALYVQALFVILNSSIVVLGALAAMAWLDWRLMLVTLLLFPATFFIVWLYQRLSAPSVARARALRSDINAQMAESIAGIAVLQASNAESRFVSRFDDTNQRYYQARLRELNANAWLLRPALDLLNVLLLIAVIYSYGQRELGGVEIGVLYAFVGYIGRVVEPLIQITLQFGQLQQAVVAASRVSHLLRETAAPQSAADGAIAAGAVSFRGLRFGYQPEHPVLHELSLEIPAGGFVGIVGHTGSGKSTLLSLLLRFYRPQQGQILIDGQPLDDIGDAAFRAGVGLVPQDPFLLAASARENIDMGRNLPQSEIEEAARAAGVHELILSLENGYDSDMGESGARLSSGQKQLIAIARALAGKPRILLLDEATSHIDSETERLVQQALAKLAGKITLISIAHRLSTIRDADAIIVLNHGRIAETGDHEQLMQLGGIYQRLYLLQQMQTEDEA